MKHKILIAFAIIGCLSFVYAGDEVVNWNKEDRQEKRLEEKNKELRELVVEIDMITSHAISVAEDTLASLNKNLAFFEKIETDEEYRECVVLEEYINDIEKDKKIATRLHNEKKVSFEQYKSYLSKAAERKSRLEQNLDKNKCK